MEPLHCGRTLAEVEREYILATLECCHGNRTHAASLLKISIRCLRIKLHDYAQAGCAVCEPHAHFDHVDYERDQPPSAPRRGH
jgi:hypothetical protein